METCRFEDFLVFLEAFWDQLKGDGHLRPQQDWFGGDAFFNHRLDRDQLIKQLPPLLEPLLPAGRLQRILQELQVYEQQFRQRFTNRWEQAYSK